VSVAAKTSILAFLALLGGVGTIYAPVPTFTAVAAAFVLGLWVFTRDGRRSLVGHNISEDEKERSKPRSTLTTKLVSGYLLIWWLALVAPLTAYSPRGGPAVQSTIEGSLRDQVLIVSFGLVGSIFLPAAIKRFDPAFRGVAALWTLYLGWALVSLLWSVYPLLTVRNVVALSLVSIGTFGLGAGFYGSLPHGRDLFVRHVLVASVISALAILGPLPFRWDQYDLLDPAARLSIGGDFTTYVVRPIMCALLLLFVTSILGVRRWRRRDWYLVMVFVLPLLALKSRGPVLWAMLAMVIFYLCYKTRLYDRILQAGLLLVVSLGTYVYYSEGVFAPLVPYLTRGSVESTTALTGRVPLWDVLLPEVAQRPWLGAGFAAFWSPDKLRQLQLLLGEWAVSAHNGFLEEALNTGVVGLAILLAFCLYAMAVGVRQARLGDPFGWLAFTFVVFYLLLNLTNALVQEALEVPFMIILAIFGLMANRSMTGASTPRRAASAVRRRVASRR
jgi:exopolysaccharide production protein ExoQ